MPLAREFVRRHVEDPARAETAALLVSELVTNAVRHARTGVTVVVFDGQPLRVEVEDGSEQPPLPAPFDVGASGGRGLQIVETFARDWGTRPSAAGKVVWFEL